MVAKVLWLIASYLLSFEFIKLSHDEFLSFLTFLYPLTPITYTYTHAQLKRLKSEYIQEF